MPSSFDFLNAPSLDIQYILKYPLFLSFVNKVLKVTKKISGSKSLAPQMGFEHLFIIHGKLRDGIHNLAE